MISVTQELHSQHLARLGFGPTLSLTNSFRSSLFDDQFKAISSPYRQFEEDLKAINAPYRQFEKDLKAISAPYRQFEKDLKALRAPYELFEKQLEKSELKPFFALHNLVGFGLSDLEKILIQLENLMHTRSCASPRTVKTIILYVREQFDEYKELHQLLPNVPASYLMSASPMAAKMFATLHHIRDNVFTMAGQLDLAVKQGGWF